MTYIYAPAAVLYRAIELLDQRGWCRGKFKDSSGALCALGAINQTYASEAAVFTAITHLRIEMGGSIQDFNDIDARDKSHVQQKMRKVAGALES